MVLNPFCSCTVFIRFLNVIHYLPRLSYSKSCIVVCSLNVPISSTNFLHILYTTTPLLAENFWVNGTHLVDTLCTLRHKSQTITVISFNKHKIDSDFMYILDILNVLNIWVAIFFIYDKKKSYFVSKLLYSNFIRYICKMYNGNCHIFIFLS